jgi:hypothetical protein
MDVPGRPQVQPLGDPSDRHRRLPLCLSRQVHLGGISIGAPAQFPLGSHSCGWRTADQLLAAEPGNRFGAPRRGEQAVNRPFHRGYRSPPAAFNPPESVPAKALGPSRAIGVEHPGGGCALQKQSAGARALPTPDATPARGLCPRGPHAPSRVVTGAPARHLLL